MSKKQTFRATDAFTYVDTYRRAILNHASRITSEKEKLEEKMWGMAVVPSRLYAEWRAHEHALRFVVESKDPEVVVIGPDDGSEEAPDPAERAEEVRARLEQAEADLAQAQRKLRQATEREHDHEVEMVRKNQELARVKRKLSQTYSSISVVSTTFLVVLVVLLAIRFLR